MRSSRPSLVAGAIALALCTGTASAQFSGTWIFGDSLSDAGQFGARFTTNPGLVSPMYVGQNWGFTSTPSFQGGNDFAQGGARVNTPQGGLPPGTPDLSIAQQVNALIAKGPLDRNALYQIQGGGNDLLTLGGQYLQGQITQAQLQAGLGQAALDLAAQVGKLQAAGARYILLQNLGDAGKTPYAISLGQQASFSQLAGLFNTTLNSAVGAANLRVIQFDTYKFQNEILANAAAYGFVNVTQQVCTTASSLQCTPSTLKAPNGNLTWFWADTVHPTTGTSILLAEAAASMITGPEQISALGEAPMGVERANWRAIDGRMFSGIDRVPSGKKIQAWASYDYAGEDITGTGVSTSGNINTVAVGGDVRLSDSVLAGVAFTYSEYRSDFSNSGGSFKLNEPMLTFYAGYGDGPWYVGGTLGTGYLDYDSVKRDIALGAVTRTESGKTTGYHNVARLLGGYWFKQAGWDHGPFAKLTWEKAVVRQFSETGADSTALTYGQQENEALISSIGWQVAGDISGWRPFARATWEYNFKNDERWVSATPVGVLGTYSVPVAKPDENYALFDLGVSKDFGGVTGYLSGNASAGKSNGDFWAVTVGFRMPI
ncbi:MAG TPA: autotransporter domain-containing protein [Casimicrobiaceae bacterium]|nr:autotransporter domain-containing protein [Casimicrobiaceae bacterium]